MTSSALPLPRWRKLLLGLGELRRMDVDRDGAIADYEKAIELKPDYAEAYYDLGNAYRAGGNLDRSIADYDKAIQLKPDYAEAQTNLNSLLELKKKTSTPQ